MRSEIAILAFLAAGPTISYAQDLPPGAGSDIVQRDCSSCHGLDVISDQGGHDAKGWQVIVSAMINNGAAVTPQEESQIVAYLAKAFPQQ